MNSNFFCAEKNYIQKLNNKKNVKYRNWKKIYQFSFKKDYRRAPS